MKREVASFISTPDDFGVFIARIALSSVFIPHGLQKILGLFGGYGFSATLSYFTSLGVPAVLAFLIIMAESLGSMALFVGLFGRFMAFGISMVMLGAIFLVHVPNGFFMNWGGAQKGEGFEFHLLAIGLALVIMIKGSGKFSLDRALHTWIT
jgi:putative oxidoreductase